MKNEKKKELKQAGGAKGLPRTPVVKEYAASPPRGNPNMRNNFPQYSGVEPLVV